MVDDGGTQREVVTLQLPADVRQLRTARQVAASVGSLAGYGLRAIESIRVAVDEGCLWLIESGDGQRLELDFVLGGPEDSDWLSVRGTTSRGPEGPSAERDELAQLIVAATCDACEFVHLADSDEVTFTFGWAPPGGGA